jgi:hypothetical protein
MRPPGNNGIPRAILSLYASGDGRTVSRLTLEPNARGCGVEPVHIARVRVYQDKRPNRRAYLGDFPEPVRYGVNTGVKAFYKIEPEEELPSTLDHLVAAAAG